LRIVVLSDSHRHYDALEEAVLLHRADADLFIFLGDGEYELDLLRSVLPELKFLTVSGNCDYGSDQPDSGLTECDGRVVFYTHGFRFGVKSGLEDLKREARRLGADIALFGHTHIPYVSYEDGLWIMNPGSIGRPRVGGPSYGIVDLTAGGIAMHTAEL
jgi:putative phosphoesterase